MKCSLSIIALCLSLLGVESAPIFDPAKTYLIFSGDSITANANFYGYWMTNTLGWSNFAFNTNAADTGEGLSFETNKWETTLKKFSPGPGTNALYFLWVGANDYTDTLLGITPYQYCAQLSNYWVRAQASNMTVIAFTILTREFFDGGSAGSQTNRTIINNFIRFSDIPDYVIDTGLWFSNNFDPVFFPDDHTHPGTNTHAIIAGKIDQILAGPRHNTTRPLLHSQTINVKNAVLY